MFTISRKKEVVEIKIEPNVLGAEGWYYTATIVANSELAAQFIANAVNEERRKTLQRIRGEAYDKGFSDAKAKRRKETWFNAGF